MDFYLDMKLSLLIMNDNDKLIMNGKQWTSAKIVKLEDQICDGGAKVDGVRRSMIMKMIMIMCTLYSKLWQFHQRYTSDDTITVNKCKNL